MNKYPTLCVAISVALLFLIPGVIAQDSFKFGVVDTQQVFENYKRAQEANEVLKTAEDRLRGELEAIREEIRTMEERLTKQKLFLDDPQTESIENEIRLKKQGYQRQLEIGQESILEKQKELVEPILTEIEALIKKMGKADGYSLILEKRLVTLYVDDSYDLTQNILEKLNQAYKPTETEAKSGQDDSE